MDRVEHRTEAGSRVTPISKSSWRIEFDWFEEEACIEAEPSVDVPSMRLHWSCECCEDGGQAALVPVETKS